MNTPSAAAMDEALVSPEFLADPYPILRQLREEDPVHWSESIGGWILTRYDDIGITFKDVAYYSNEGRLARAVEYLPNETRAKLKPFEDHYRTKGLLHSDPPDHTRLRAVVTKAFTPRTVDAIKPRITEIVNQLLDQVHSAGHMDVISDLAVSLPISVLGEILGVPASDGMLFKSWADKLLAFQGVNKPSEEILLEAQQALLEIREYLRGLIDYRKRQPREDLISQLAAAEADGDRLSESELLNTCITLLVAGHETTTSLIGNGIYTLLAHPDQWHRLQSTPSLLSGAIEEILRYESPVSRQPRLMKQDAELRGEQIQAGQMVFQMLNAANRDPAQFSNPDEFDIGRKPNLHIAFGLGAHFCVGAGLARVEAAIVFKTVIERLPKIRLTASEPDWDLHKANSRMLRTLPVEF